MKRTLSLMLVAMMAISMSITSLAATDNGILLGVDHASGLSLSNALLKPGESYRFPVETSINGVTQPLTDELLETHNFRSSNTGEGKTVTGMKLAEIGGVYYVTAEVKAGWPATQTEEEYSFKLVNKADGKTVSESKIGFYTGYGIADDAVIDALQNEDMIQVDNNAPIFTKEQLARIARINNYKKVNFSGSNWTYHVNVTDLGDINMVHNINGIKEILAKYEDNSFEFLTFPAGTKFASNGTMELDVSDLVDGFNEKFFVYRYLDGKLTLIPSQLDTEEELLTFTTNTLGRFVITDKEIKDAVVTPGNNGSNNAGGSNNTGNESNQNPSTGADPVSVLPTLSALAIFAALTGGAILRKRK